MMSFNYYTYTHSVNVCTFSVALAQYSGITDRKELFKLGTGALLHDVGKTKISDSILRKKGRLTEEEFAIIRKHPDWGVELIRETDIVSDDVYFPILQHHEREDGSGYPKGLTKTEINDYSKIVAIADVFDAMTTERAYRSAVESFSALKTMFHEVNHFDHRLLKQFTRMLGPQRMAVIRH
jgi:HD-GYP domain-containing protein (c-di-GMP phosphodiesterase class II)